MSDDQEKVLGYVCFSGAERVAEGSLATIALSAWQLLQAASPRPVLAFSRTTGEVVDLNLSGSMNEIAARYAPMGEEPPKRGRPKLGVVAREITLLPRHWDWLERQPGGASVTLRRLVDGARKSSAEQNPDQERIAAAYKFMSAMAGDLPLFEEASRALFAQNLAQLKTCITKWPEDIQSELAFLLKTLREPTP